MSYVGMGQKNTIRNFLLINHLCIFECFNLGW